MRRKMLIDTQYKQKY